MPRHARTSNSEISVSDVDVVEANGTKTMHAQAWVGRNHEALRGVAFTLAIFAVSKVLATLVVYGGKMLLPDRNLKQALLAWDSAWYQNVIANGYPSAVPQGQGVAGQSTIGFFPLYPVTARGFEDVSGLTPFQSGLIVSLFFGATAAIALWFLARRLTNVMTANLAVTLFCLAPASFASLMLMSEGVMITFSVLCLNFLLAKRWVLAGLCAGLATAARPNALVLVGCCAWAAAVAIYKSRDWKALIAPVLAPTGILAFFGYLYLRTGDFLAWWHVVNNGWGYSGIDKFASIKVLPALGQPFAELDKTIGAVALVMGIVGLCLIAYWRPPMVVVIFSVGIFYLAFFNGGPASKVRYMWSAFPFAIAAAYWAKTELRRTTLISGAAVLMGLYSLIATRTIVSIF